MTDLSIPKNQRLARIQAIAQATQTAQRAFIRIPAAQRDLCLTTLAQRLIETTEKIVTANQKDLASAQQGGQSSAFLNRLVLDHNGIKALADDLETVAALPDPLQEEFEQRTLPNGLTLTRRRAPLGVIGVIYESRPNVTIDIAAAAIKSGNGVLLRGGREARHTNLALLEVLQNTLVACKISPAMVNYIDEPEREAVADLLQLSEYIDVIIPRGGQGLVDFCRAHSRIPIIAGGAGVVHLFVDESADLTRSLSVIENAKIQRPAACNALDTLLLHKVIAETLLQKLAPRLAANGVHVHADEEVYRLLAATGLDVEPLTPEKLDREWLSLDLNICVVENLETAIEHINQHGSGHSESILTENLEHAEKFLNEIDAAVVYHNASTRFSDGGQFGMGVEVAVATGRLPPRGPVGPADLTTLKWVARGAYLARA